MIQNTRKGQPKLFLQRGVDLRRLRDIYHNPTEAQVTDPHQAGIAKDPLKFYDTYPCKVQKPEELVFIKMKKTNRAAATTGFEVLRDNYAAFTLNKAALVEDGEGKRMIEYFLKDPMGNTVIPLNDASCWQMREALPENPDVTLGSAPAAASATTPTG